MANDTTITDQEITTLWPGQSEQVLAADTDTVDQGGSGDDTDTTDEKTDTTDTGDSDGTDTQDADGTDS
jgi:hypothetical protein